MVLLSASRYCHVPASVMVLLPTSKFYCVPATVIIVHGRACEKFCVLQELLCQLPVVVIFVFSKSWCVKKNTFSIPIAWNVIAQSPT